jgi:hypothetical protein
MLNHFLFNPALYFRTMNGYLGRRCDAQANLVAVCSQNHQFDVSANADTLS